MIHVLPKVLLQEEAWSDATQSQTPLTVTPWPSVNIFQRIDTQPNGPVAIKISLSPENSNFCDHKQT
jgi:hypothetical protein